MLINIKTSEENKVVVQELTRKLKLGAENVIARIAFSYSLSKKVNLDLKDQKDSKGKEYKDDILFGKYRDYYIALVCQHYNLHKSDPDIGKYIKMHIDHGLTLINKYFEANQNMSGFQFLLDCVENGINGLENAVVPDHVSNFHQNLQKEYFEKAIDLQIGKELSNGNRITCTINNTLIHNNAHIAVAGNSGTGKTQFALSLLKQFSVLSEQKVKFLYLDFKGVKEEDKKGLDKFMESTKCTLIDTPQTPFPINPLSFIDNINEKNRLLGINKFVDIIEKHAGIGKNQVQLLKDATKEVFIESKNGQYPSFKNIYEKLLELSTDGKLGKLQEVMQGLSEFDIFDNSIKSGQSFIDGNYYFSLSGDLPANIRFTSVFLIINYVYNVFMNMANAPVNEDKQAMRYVLLIDEAHVIFREKKSHDLLQNMLREIRSKGVSIILLSQGIEEFNQPTFDFSSMCETTILFDIKDKTNIKMMQKFLGFGEKEGHLLARNMEKIEKGKAVSNIKEFKKAELFEVSQFWRD